MLTGKIIKQEKNTTKKNQKPTWKIQLEKTNFQTAKHSRLVSNTTNKKRP